MSNRVFFPERKKQVCTPVIADVGLDIRFRSSPDIFLISPLLAAVVSRVFQKIHFFSRFDPLLLVILSVSRKLTYRFTGAN